MEKHIHHSLESYLSYEDKLKLKNLITSYSIKKDTSYLSLIGIDSISLLNKFKTYLLDNTNTTQLDYNTISILDQITDYDKSYIIDLYSLDSSFNIKDVVQYFRFNRDFIPEKKIKLFILASFETLDLFSKIAYDFVTFSSFYGKFNDNNFTFNYEVDNSKLNKLISQFKNLRANTPKYLQIDLMIQISQEAHNISNKEIELKYLQLALKKALKLKNDYLLGSIYNSLGNYYNSFNITKAILNYKDALKIAEKINNVDARIKTLNNLGIISLELLDIDEAESNFKIAKKLSEDTNDKKELALSYRNLSTVYSRKKDYNLALNMIKQSMNIAKNLNDEFLIKVNLATLASTYALIYDYKNAIKYYKESLVLDKELNDTNSILTTMYNLAKAYYDIFDFTIAMNYLKKILKISNGLNEHKILSATYSLMAKVELVNLNFDEANSYMNKSLSYFNKNTTSDIEKFQMLISTLEIYRYTNFEAYVELLNKHSNLKQKVFLYECGVYSLEIKDYNLAIKYSMEALVLFEEYKDRSYQILSLLNIARAYIALENYDDAEKQLILAYSKVEENIEKEFLVELYLVYYDYYLHVNDIVKGQEYFNKAQFIIKNSNHKLLDKRLKDIKNKISL